MVNRKLSVFSLVMLICFLSGPHVVKGQKKKQPQIDEQAPDLELKNPYGEKIALSSLEGKVVLVDFWASWGKPCRRENPKLVKIYKKYKNARFKGGEKGFTIYSVSIDNHKKDWTRAIELDGLIWKNHVSDLKGWNSKAVKIYGIKAIPKSFLINGEGKIIDKDVVRNLDFILRDYMK